MQVSDGQVLSQCKVNSAGPCINVWSTFVACRRALHGQGTLNSSMAPGGQLQVPAQVRVLETWSASKAAPGQKAEDRHHFILNDVLRLISTNCSRSPLTAPIIVGDGQRNIIPFQQTPGAKCASGSCIGLEPCQTTPSSLTSDSDTTSLFQGLCLFVDWGGNGMASWGLESENGGYSCQQSNADITVGFL